MNTPHRNTLDFDNRLSEGSARAERNSLIEIAASLGLLLVFTFAMYGWLSELTPLQGARGLLLSFLIPFVALRLRPGWFITILLVIAWCSQGTPGRSLDMFNTVKLAAWGGLLFVLRAKWNSLRDILILRISDDSKDQMEKSLFAIRGTANTLVTILLFLALALLASFLLGMNPLGGGSKKWEDWAEQHGQALWPNANLLVLILLVLVLLREWDWRQIDREQAELAVRSESLKWQYHDLIRTIQTRRTMLLKKQLTTFTSNTEES